MSVVNLDYPACRKIIDLIYLEDVINLSTTSSSHRQMIQLWYQFQVTFPLTHVWQDDRAVLKIVKANSVTDSECVSTTRQQVSSVNISQLKQLVLICPDHDNASCLISCSNYHQRLIYNIWYKSWKQHAATFRLERLKIDVAGNASRLRVVLAYMDSLQELDLTFPMNLVDRSYLVDEACKARIKKLSIKILSSHDDDNYRPEHGFGEIGNPSMTTDPDNSIFGLSRCLNLGSP